MSSFDFDYNPAEQEQRQGLLPDYIKPGSRVKMAKAQWNSPSPLVFRPLPALSRDGQPLPMRASLADNGYTTWRIRLPIVMYAGPNQSDDKEISPKKSFIAYNPMWRKDGYVSDNNPYVAVFYRLLKWRDRKLKAVIGSRDLNDSGWIELIQGKKRLFTPPDDYYLMRALVYQNTERVGQKGKDGYFPVAPYLHVVSQDKKSVKPPLGAAPGDVQQLVLCKAPYPSLRYKDAYRWHNSLPGWLDRKVKNPDPSLDASYDGVFQFPDVTSLSNGSWIYIYQESCMSLDPMSVAHSGVIQTKVDGVQYGDPEQVRKKATGESYLVAVRDEFKFQSGSEEVNCPRDISKYWTAICATYQRWDDILQIPETPEQNDEDIACWMAESFKQFPDLLEWGWLETDYFRRPSIRAILGNRTSAQVPTVPADEVDEPTVEKIIPQDEEPDQVEPAIETMSDGELSMAQDALSPFDSDEVPFEAEAQSAVSQALEQAKRRAESRAGSKLAKKLLKLKKGK